MIMLWFRPFLAQNMPDVIPNASHWMGLTLMELVTLLGALALLTLLLVLWAVYIRKTPRRHSHHHYKYPAPAENKSADSVSQDGPDSGSERRYRRKRRRRRQHRPRNPTLAETGGLPPLRTEHPPDPLP